MSYNNVELEGKDNHRSRPFYTAVINQTGKIEIPFKKASGFFVNILHSDNTAFGSFQSKTHKMATYVPLGNGGSVTLTELNPEYDVFFKQCTTLNLPHSGKITHLLLDIQALGTAGKVIVEVTTNIF